MKKIWIFIKKIFAIIISIIYGVFKKDNSNLKSVETKDDIVKSNGLKGKNKSSMIIQEDDESTKSRSSYSSDKKNEEDKVIYYAKRDIQKLVFIQKNIKKIEIAISKCDNLEEMYELQSQLKDAKMHFEKIASYYEKIVIEYPIVKDIKIVIDDTSKMINQQEKIIDNKIFDLKKKELEEEKEDNLEEEIIDLNEATLVDNINIKKDLDDRLKNGIDDKLTNEEKQSFKQDDSFIEKDNNELLSEIEITNVCDVLSFDEDKNIEVKQDSKIRNMVIDTSILKTSIDMIKSQRDAKTISEISAIIARAHAVAASSNISMLLQLNPTMAVSTSLYINNEMRRSRSLTGTKVKRLGLNKVIEVVGNNPVLQVRHIMANSLKEIRKLKNELRKYGNIPEVINALNELNELEMELLMQLNELQLQNNRQHGRGR